LSIKELLEKIYTAKYGIWVVLGLIICLFIWKTIIDYQEFDQRCENFKIFSEYERARIIMKFNISEDNKTCIGECEDELLILARIEQKFRKEDNFFLGQRCIDDSNKLSEFLLSK